VTVENTYFQAVSDFVTNAQYEPQFIENRERQIGFRLPAAIRDWYARFGQSRVADMIEEIPLVRDLKLGSLLDRRGNTPTSSDLQHLWLTVLSDGCGGWTASVPLNGDDDPPVIHERFYEKRTLLNYRYSAYMFDHVALTSVGDGYVNGQQGFALHAANSAPTESQLASLAEILNLGPTTLQRDIDLEGDPLRTVHYVSVDASHANWRFFRNDSCLWIRDGIASETGERTTVWYFRANHLRSLESLVHDVHSIASVAETLQLSYPRSEHGEACAELLSELR
jgi:hypothetical protein